jgi:hypothetical protein
MSKTPIKPPPRNLLKEGIQPGRNIGAGKQPSGKPSGTPPTGGGTGNKGTTGKK